MTLDSPRTGPRNERDTHGVDSHGPEMESPIGAYLWWCGHVGADAHDLDTLQEWDYLHADETTDAERRTLTAWARSAGIFGAPDTAPHPKR